MILNCGWCRARALVFGIFVARREGADVGAGTQAFELDNNNDKDVNAKRNHRREETCGDDIDDSNDDDENDGWWLEVDFILSALSEFSW